MKRAMKFGNSVFRFRAWHLPTKELIQPINMACASGFFADSDYIVTQSTGVVDENGVEIFCGDIVYLSYANFPAKIAQEDKFLIEFSRGSFVVTPKILTGDGTLNFPKLTELSGLDKNGDEIWVKTYPPSQPLSDFNICVVMGNIFQNENLIKV